MMNNLRDMFKYYLNDAVSIYKMISCSNKDSKCKIIGSNCECKDKNKCDHELFVDDCGEVIDFDKLKENFCSANDIQLIGSCDGIEFLSNGDIALIEFKLDCKKINQGKKLREQIFSSLEIICNVLNQPDKFRKFVREHIICYIVFSKDKLDYDSKYAMSLAKDANEKLKLVGVDYFNKFLLKDIRVLYKDELIKIKLNWGVK